MPPAEKRKIVWTIENYQRLLAAIIAAHPGLKLNYTNIAGMFGEGATYDTIEGRFRQFKKQAAQLAAEVASGERPGTAPSTPRKRKAQDAAATGKQRPTKSPRKKRVVKEEFTSDEDDLEAMPEEWGGDDSD